MQQATATGGQGSHYVTPETAKSALRLVAPMIEQALADRNIVGSGFLYVVVMNPALTPVNASFEQAILYEHAFGDCTLWDADYAGFARAKAHLSWSLSRDGHTLQHALPHLLRTGDLSEMQERWVEASRACVREHPLVSIGVAVAAGMLLSRLMAR